MKKIFATITKAVYLNEDHYCNFLELIEKQNGEIENATIRRSVNRVDDIILEITLKP